MHERLEGALPVVPPGGGVAVLRALPGLGDLLSVVPALRAVRTSRPDVEVTYIGLPETAPLVRRFSRYVDRFLPFPGFPGLPDRRPDVRRLPGFLAQVHSFRFDLAIQLQGSGELTNNVAALLGARRIAGHYRGSGPPCDAALFLPWSDACSEVRRALRLMAHLGCPADDEDLEFPIARGAAAELTALPHLASIAGRPYVVLHPGAAAADRRWRVDGFAEVGDRLAEAGYAVVLTGSAVERPITHELGGLMRNPVVDLAGRTSLDALAVLLSGASILICNDTGVSHLAAALRIPSVIVFRSTDPARWAPLDRVRHRPAQGSVRHVLAEARRLLHGVRLDAA